MLTRAAFHPTTDGTVASIELTSLAVMKEGLGSRQGEGVSR